MRRFIIYDVSLYVAYMSPYISPYISPYMSPYMCPFRMAASNFSSSSYLSSASSRLRWQEQQEVCGKGGRGRRVQGEACENLRAYVC